MRFKVVMIFLFSFSISYAQIRIVLSAALTDAHFEFRKAQYVETFGILAQYGYYHPYVIEALKKRGPTFLDEYTSNVFYSTADDPRFRNKGINEARTMLEGIIHFGFDPEDIVIKLTGRYQLISNHFIKLVEDNPDVDAFVKVDKHENVYTLGFAMRCKYMKEMYKGMEWNKMEKRWIIVEQAVGSYIKRKKKKGNFKVMYIENLGIRVNLFGSSTAPGAPEEIRYY